MSASNAIRANALVQSIGVDTHLSYTDGAYASEANVAADLAYLGIDKIRDAVPNPNGGVPAANQIAALEALAKSGIKLDLLTSPNQISVAQTLQEIETLDAAAPGAVLAVEGPNEINNNPVTYNGLTGQAAATAFQEALYSAIKGTAATANIAVYEFTGGITAPLAASGSPVATRNGNGSYTLTNGQIGFPVTLPSGVSNVSITYTTNGSNNPGSGLFNAPGAGQQTGITYGGNGVISYTYNNTSGAPRQLYVDFIDYGATDILTNVTVTAQGGTTNLVTFDPNLSLAGQADDANIHPYASQGGAVSPLIAANYQTAFGTPTPGPRVITETGYETDPNAGNGVSQLVQAQQEINAVLDAYQSGVATTYIYELLDELSDLNNTNAEYHFGLFTFNNTPKLAATALHDLTSILADTSANAASFTPGTLNITQSGNIAADSSLLIEKSSGVFDLALWNDADAGTASANQITLSLGGTYQTVITYDVVTDAMMTYNNVSQITVAVGGDPMIVEVDPNPAAPSTPAPPAAPAPTLTTTPAPPTAPAAPTPAPTHIVPVTASNTGQAKIMAFIAAARTAFGTAMADQQFAVAAPGGNASISDIIEGFHAGDTVSLAGIGAAGWSYALAATSANNEAMVTFTASNPSKGGLSESLVFAGLNGADISLLKLTKTAAGGLTITMPL